MVKPFSPSEAKKQHAEQVNEDVLDVVNGLLAQRAGSNRITIKQAEIVEALIAKGHNRADLFDKNMLDFEDAYKSNGWGVSYDKPGYNESYEAFWVFQVK